MAGTDLAVKLRILLTDERVTQKIGHRPSLMCSSWRYERDAWLNCPARISAQRAATIHVDPHALHIALDAAVGVWLGKVLPDW
mgnify:CR=1 FL=1